MPANAYNRATQVGPPAPIVIEKLMPWVEKRDDLDSNCSSLCFSALSEERLLAAVRLAKRDLRKRRQESLNSSPIRPQPEETTPIKNNVEQVNKSSSVYSPFTCTVYIHLILLRERFIDDQPL